MEGEAIEPSIAVLVDTSGQPKLKQVARSWGGRPRDLECAIYPVHRPFPLGDFFVVRPFTLYPSLPVNDPLADLGINKNSPFDFEMTPWFGTLPVFLEFRHVGYISRMFKLLKGKRALNYMGRWACENCMGTIGVGILQAVLAAEVQRGTSSQPPND